MPKPPFNPFLALLIAIFSIQAGASFGKTLFPELGFAGTSALRVSLAALLLLLIFRPNLAALTWADWKHVLPFGLSLGLMNYSYYTALSEMPNGSVVTIEFAGPLLLAAVLSRRALDFVWVGLAALGIVLMTLTPQSASDMTTRGILFAGLAAVFWAAYIYFGGPLGQRLQGGVAITAGMLVAALVTFPLGAQDLGVLAHKPQLLLSGLVVAVLSSALPYTLEMHAMRHIPARIFGVVLSIEPAVAALMGWIMLHERLSPWQWVALFAVVVASAGVSLTKDVDAG